jgi:hypothetical protein
METQQFDELKNELNFLRAENFNLQKDVRLIKIILIVTSAVGLFFAMGYGLGTVIGILERYLS